MEAAAAPAISVDTPQAAWAFVVSGHLEGKTTFDGYQVVVRNLRTDRVITASVQGDYFAAGKRRLGKAQHRPSWRCDGSPGYRTGWKC